MLFFFGSGIHTAPAGRVRRHRIGYQQIAQAGSFQGMYWSPLDSPAPPRSYNAASAASGQEGNSIFRKYFFGADQKKKEGATTLARGILRVVYRFGIFGRYSVGISRYLPYRYRRKIRSVHFGIKKGAVPPFFLKRGATAPFLRSSATFWKKGGRKGGKYTKRGGSIPTEIPKIQQI
jgi:hypothetical protein